MRLREWSKEGERDDKERRRKEESMKKDKKRKKICNDGELKHENPNIFYQEFALENV